MYALRSEFHIDDFALTYAGRFGFARAEDAQAAMENPTTRLSTRRTGDFAEFTVKDAGPGFPEELMGRVFEPYVTTKAGGTGLGLAIVKKIVDEHHGRIRINNRPAGGAEISLRLPLALERVVQP